MVGKYQIQTKIVLASMVCKYQIQAKIALASMVGKNQMQAKIALVNMVGKYQIQAKRYGGGTDKTVRGRYGQNGTGAVGAGKG